MPKQSAYERVTARMVELLENGVCPWRQFWAGGGGFPESLTSGKRYRGVNVFLLSCASYSSPYWLTFKQAQARGGCVRKGEKGLPAVFWHFPNSDKLKAASEAGKELPAWERAVWLRSYTVFNVAQCDGLKDVPPPPDAADLRTSAQRIEAAERIVAGYEGGPEIKHGFSRAGYGRGDDVVMLPAMERFESDELYYSALFHELAHSTGSPDRLNRTKGKEFGDEDYAREELVAELTAAMLCAECGIARSTEDVNAAYLEGWAKVLQGDAKLIVQAASAAQRAAEWMQGVRYEKATA